MGGSSGSVTVGYKYYVGMHMALCRGPVDYMLQAKVDDRIALAGSLISGSYYVNKPKLFGGSSREGGIVGTLDVLGGESTQTVNSYLSSKLGAFVPAFRGTLSVVLRQMYLGLNPYLKKWSFRASRIHVRQTGLTQWYDAKAEINTAISNIAVLTYPAIDIEANHVGFVNGVTVTTSNASDIVRLTKPSNLKYKAWSPWPSDDSTVPLPPPVPGVTWCNQFYVRQNGVDTFYLPSLYISKDAAYTAVQSVLPIYLTGATSYTIWIYDPNPGDNRGGFSIKAELLQSFPDMNPAHIIRECLTDPDWGMGYAESDIDDTSFTSAADVLYTEKTGISLLWDTQTSIEDFVKLICTHINASVYVSRITGKFILKLIRKDYIDASLPVFNQSNITSIQDFVRISFGELVNSITVTYWNSSTGENSTLTVQDIALAATQGVTINTSVSYEGFTNSDVASRIAQRDLKALSTPLVSCTIYANTDASNLAIGDCFKLTWPDYDLSEMIMRVTGIGYGDGVSNRIRMTCTQDVFSTPDTAYIAPTPPEGVPTDDPPVEVALRVAFELPYLEAVQQLGQTVVDGNLATNPAIGYFSIAAARPSSNSLNALLYTDSGAGYIEQSTLDFCPFAQLDGDIDRNSLSFNITNMNDLLEIELGSWFQLDSELFEISTLIGSTITVKRALLDTVPTIHLSGTTLYFWDLYAGEDSTQYVLGETVNCKLLTTTSTDSLDLDLAPIDSITMVGRLFKPYPPGKYQTNSVYFPEIVSGDLTFTWAHRDRKQQTGSDYVGFLENSIGPEVGTTYNLRVYDENNNLIHTESGITGASYLYTNSQEIGDSGGTPGDADFASVASLLHFDGIDAAVTTTDVKGITWTFNGNVQLDTARKYFGTAALLFDGNGDYLSTTNVAINLNSTNYTVEGWAYLDAVNYATARCIFSNFLTQSNGRVYFFADTTGAFQIGEQDASGANSSGGATAASTAPLQTWFHFALVKNGTNFRLFINGISVISATSATRTSFANNFRWGRFDSSSFEYPWIGTLDDCRISKIARYSTTFTPPTSAYADNASVGRVNGKLRIELESQRDSIKSYQFHNTTIYRAGYGFNYGKYYGGAP